MFSLRPFTAIAIDSPDLIILRAPSRSFVFGDIKFLRFEELAAVRESFPEKDWDDGEEEQKKIKLAGFVFVEGIFGSSLQSEPVSFHLFEL